MKVILAFLLSILCYLFIIYNFSLSEKGGLLTILIPIFFIIFYKIFKKLFTRESKLVRQGILVIIIFSIAAILSLSDKIGVQNIEKYKTKENLTN